MDGQGVSRIIEVAHIAAVKPFVVNEPGYKALLHPHDKVDHAEGITTRIWEIEPLPCEKAAAQAVGLNTLQGFADYVTANRDGLNLTEVLAVVTDHTTVLLIGKVVGDLPTHPVYVFAKCEPLIKVPAVGASSLTSVTPQTCFHFGQWLDPESFNIGLQSLFVETDERARVLEIVGNISTDGVSTIDDDGVSQAIVARAGVRLGKLVGVPNPVRLAPFRTFRDIDQPESLFVLRVRGESGEQPRIALFEADGGCWRLQAIESIAAFLRQRLPAAVVVVA
jgi:hypothetical protein